VIYCAVRTDGGADCYHIWHYPHVPGQGNYKTSDHPIGAAVHTIFNMPRPSLLKDLLKKNSESSGYDAPKALSSKRGVKDQADTKSLSGTIRSVKSIAGSIASFYSLIGGGSKIPKRRRSDISRLGVPKFYPKNPKPPEDMPGVKYLNTEELGPYTAAHAKSFSSLGAPGKPWGSIVLYSHASVEDELPVYHGRGIPITCMEVKNELIIFQLGSKGSSDCESMNLLRYPV
jgi:hypothetical protein